MTNKILLSFLSMFLASKAMAQQAPAKLPPKAAVQQQQLREQPKEDAFGGSPLKVDVRPADKDIEKEVELQMISDSRARVVITPMRVVQDESGKKDRVKMEANDPMLSYVKSKDFFKEVIVEAGVPYKIKVNTKFIKANDNKLVNFAVFAERFPITEEKIKLGDNPNAKIKAGVSILKAVMFNVYVYPKKEIDGSFNTELAFSKAYKAQDGSIAVEVSLENKDDYPHHFQLVGNLIDGPARIASKIFSYKYFEGAVDDKNQSFIILEKKKVLFVANFPITKEGEYKLDLRHRMVGGKKEIGKFFTFKVTKDMLPTAKEIADRKSRQEIIRKQQLAERLDSSLLVDTKSLSLKGKVGKETKKSFRLENKTPVAIVAEVLVDKAFLAELKDVTITIPEKTTIQPGKKVKLQILATPQVGGKEYRFPVQVKFKTEKGEELIDRSIDVVLVVK